MPEQTLLLVMGAAIQVIMTPKELTRIQKKTKQIEDLEEAKRNSGYINGNGQ